MSEVGKPLKARDLVPGTIVVIAPPGQRAGVLITMWVSSVDTKHVVFAAHAIPGVDTWHILNAVRDDGELVDDKGRVVRVFEYLGEP